jgi:ribonuclease D
MHSSLDIGYVKAPWKNYFPTLRCNCNEVDDSIKLFHGCDNDLRWLASNFGFQIGGLIDTARAEQIISSTMVSVGLSALAKKYLKIGMDKSNWLIR